MNIVVVCLDTVRPDCLGAAGHPVCQTPALDRLAVDGAFVVDAYAEFPLTVPFRTALVSGNYTYPHRPWTALRSYDLHLAEILRGAGYRTAAFSDSPFRSDVGMDRGFDEFHAFPGKLQPPDGGTPEGLDLRGAYLSPTDRRDHDRWRAHVSGWLGAHRARYGAIGIELLVDRAMAWLDAASRRPQPFLLWVDSFEAHEPWVPPAHADRYQPPGYRGRYLPLPPGPSMDWLEPGELDHIRASYWGSVTYADEHVGRLVDRIDDLGMAEDTLVLVVSDHGVPLGEHGQVRKVGIPLYDEMARMLCLLRWPGRIPAGLRPDTMVQTPDLLPTILHWAGVEAHPEPTWDGGASAPGLIDGMDLAPVIDGRGGTPRDTAYFGAFGLRAAIRRGPWKLIDHRGEKPNELFDLVADPGEQINVIESEADTAARLHRKLWHFHRRWARALRV